MRAVLESRSTPMDAVDRKRKIDEGGAIDTSGALTSKWNLAIVCARGESGGVDWQSGKALPSR